MDYVLGQFHRNETGTDYMELKFPNAVAERRSSATADEEMASIFSFKDEFLYLGENNNFSVGENYYFHGKIKPDINSVQTIYVYLTYKSEVNNSRQYIKTITIAQGDSQEESPEWIDVEFLFSPIQNYDSILFKLQRVKGPDTDNKGGRTLKIAYEEISLVKNAINTAIAEGIRLIKLGVQSRPGLLMCINGEEIRTCRTGIYELKNGLITVNFFAVANAANENNNNMKNYMEEVNQREDPDAESRAFLGEPKKRTLDSFTLDYMYKKSSKKEAE